MVPEGEAKRRPPRDQEREERKKIVVGERKKREILGCPEEGVQRFFRRASGRRGPVEGGDGGGVKTNPFGRFREALLPQYRKLHKVIQRSLVVSHTEWKTHKILRLCFCHAVCFTAWTPWRLLSATVKTVSVVCHHLFGNCDKFSTNNDH